jgi:hypothetical protein
MPNEGLGSREVKVKVGVKDVLEVRMGEVRVGEGASRSGRHRSALGRWPHEVVAKAREVLGVREVKVREAKVVEIKLDMVEGGDRVRVTPNRTCRTKTPLTPTSKAAMAKTTVRVRVGTCKVREGGGGEGEWPGEELEGEGEELEAKGTQECPLGR